MKVAAILASSILAVSVAATPSWPGQIKIQEDYKVPGDNPLYFCADPKENLLEIEKVDLSPNPPEAGKSLKIKATGDFKETIDGGKMHLQVKYGLITLINQDADLCETVGKADLDCPLDKGEMTLTKEVKLPNQIPPGKYTVLADVYNEDGDKVTCLTAQVEFHR